MDIERAQQQVSDQCDRYEEALQRIKSWSEAYPVSVFPEPDLLKAARVLEQNGMTLDSISAHCMRHVVAGVGAIASEALKEVS